jgi:hypothetical protein
MRLLAARHKAIMTAVKLSRSRQNLCSLLLDNECFAMLPRSTPLAAGRLIAVRMHNTPIGSGVQSHIMCKGPSWKAT